MNPNGSIDPNEKFPSRFVEIADSSLGSKRAVMVVMVDPDRSHKKQDSVYITGAAATFHFLSRGKGEPSKNNKANFIYLCNGVAVGCSQLKLSYLDVENMDQEGTALPQC